MTTFAEMASDREQPDWPSALYDLTQAVAAALHPSDIFDAALTAIDRSLGVDRASVLLFDAAGVMRFRAWRNLSDAYRHAVDGHSPWTPNTTDASPVLVEDVRRDPSLEGLLPVFAQEDIRALAFIPLGIGQRLLGKFMLYYAEPHAFTDHEVLTARTIAAHVAFAIDQQEHRESERRFRSLADTLPALVVTTSTEGEIVQIDQSYHEYTGLTLEQARDWEHHQVIHPDDVDQAMGVWNAALSSGEPLQNEMRLRRHDGVYRWHLMQAKPVLGPEGIIEKWVTVSVDIEERKRAEARDRYLAATTAKLVSSLEHQDLLGEIARLAVPALADVCAIGLFDEANATVRVETAMTDERQRQNIDRVHLRTWLPAPAAHEVVGDRIMRGEAVFAPDAGEDWVRSCAPNAEQVAAALALRIRSLACLPLMARGSPFGIVTFAVSGTTYSEADFRVFTEVASRLSIALENRELYKSLKETAEELERANAAKDEFLGLISHELKTPLTTIRGNASVLVSRRHELEDAAREVALRDIVSESDRLHRIVENLLFLARAEQGQLPEAEPIILRYIVAKTVARHRETHPGRVFEVHEKGDPKPVVFHEGYLEQVLENLISNAEKYSPRDRPIVIEIERSSDEVTIKVLDEGIGISNDTKRIFEPFYRSESAVIRAEGLGIGLTVCKRLVEAQGGRMWAQPRAGGGSEFGFALPISPEFEQ